MKMFTGKKKPIIEFDVDAGRSLDVFFFKNNVIYSHHKMIIKEHPKPFWLKTNSALKNSISIHNWSDLNLFIIFYFHS